MLFLRRRRRPDRAGQGTTRRSPIRHGRKRNRAGRERTVCYDCFVRRCWRCSRAGSFLRSPTAPTVAAAHTAIGCG
ncbi:hypothetical protein VPH35_067456 [Triticum aestivum]